MTDRRHYEVMFIVDPKLEDATAQQTVDKYLGILRDRGGEVTKVDHWGRRKFTYEINHLNEGYYTIANVQADPDSMNELDRVLRLQDELIRHKITRPGKD